MMVTREQRARVYEVRCADYVFSFDTMLASYAVSLHLHVLRIRRSFEFEHTWSCRENDAFLLVMLLAG